MWGGMLIMFSWFFSRRKRQKELNGLMETIEESNKEREEERERAKRRKLKKDVVTQPLIVDSIGTSRCDDCETYSGEHECVCQESIITDDNDNQTQTSSSELSGGSGEFGGGGADGEW